MRKNKGKIKRLLSRFVSVILLMFCCLSYIGCQNKIDNIEEEYSRVGIWITDSYTAYDVPYEKMKSMIEETKKAWLDVGVFFEITDNMELYFRTKSSNEALIYTLSVDEEVSENLILINAINTIFDYVKMRLYWSVESDELSCVLVFDEVVSNIKYNFDMAMVKMSKIKN